MRLMRASMPNDEPIRKHAALRPLSFSACRRSARPSDEKLRPLRREHAEPRAARELCLDLLRLARKARCDLRPVRIVRQAALRQLDELEFAVGPEPADILVRRCRVIALLELADRDERDVEHRVTLRHSDFPGSTARFSENLPLCGLPLILLIIIAPSSRFDNLRPVPSKRTLRISAIGCPFYIMCLLA